jgi:hypothetical protein
MINRFIPGVLTINVQIYSLFGSVYHSGLDHPGLSDVIETESEHDLMGTAVVISQVGKGDVI